MSSLNTAELEAVAATQMAPTSDVPRPMAAGTETSSRRDPMRVILAVVGLAIAMFLAFSTFSIYKARQGSAQLGQIKSLYFPVLEQIDISVVQIDKMEEQYMTGVMTAERDPIDKAGEHHAKADAALAEVLKLYPERGAETKVLKGRLQSYKQQADLIAEAILSKSAGDFVSKAAAMNKTLADLRRDIKAFRQSSYDQFASALASSRQVAQLNLVLGIVAGVLNLGFMGVLVYFIRNNVRMMAVIAQQNATLEQRVAERTAQLTQKTNDIAAMLQNMSLGVCTVIPGNQIHPEYSAHLRLITGVEDLAGKPLLPAVFGQSTLGENALDQISAALSCILGEDEMMFSFNSHLLPAEMELHDAAGAIHIVQMQWSPILGAGDTVEKVLLLLQDVTELRALEIEASAQRANMDTIARVLKIPAGKFNDFIGSARQLAQSCKTLIEGTPQRDDAAVAQLFRNMHTIKGNARMFDFTAITDAAHAAEQRYDRLRKDANEPWDQARLMDDLSLVESALDRFQTVNDDTLGRKGRSQDLVSGRGAFLGLDVIEKLKANAEALAAQPLNDASKALARQLGAQLGALGLVSSREVNLVLVFGV